MKLVALSCLIVFAPSASPWLYYRNEIGSELKTYQRKFAVHLSFISQHIFTMQCHVCTKWIRSTHAQR